MVRVLVCGGRDFDDYEKVQRELDYFHSEYTFTTVIHGCAKGADTCAGQWAKSEHLTVVEFPANWTLHGRSAGPIRNTQMIKEGKPDLVIAFPGGVGTRNMIKQAYDAGIKVEVVT